MLRGDNLPRSMLFHNQPKFSMDNIFDHPRIRPRRVRQEIYQKRIQITAKDQAYYAGIVKTFGFIDSEIFLNVGRQLLAIIKAYTTEPYTITLYKNKEVAVGRRIGPEYLDQGKEVPTEIRLHTYKALIRDATTLTLKIKSHTSRGILAVKLEWSHLRPHSLFVFASEYRKNPGDKAVHEGTQLRQHMLQYSLRPIRHNQLYTCVFGLESTDALRHREIPQIVW